MCRLFCLVRVVSRTTRGRVFLDDRFAACDVHRFRAVSPPCHDREVIAGRFHASQTHPKAVARPRGQPRNHDGGLADKNFTTRRVVVPFGVPKPPVSFWFVLNLQTHPMVNAGTFVPPSRIQSSVFVFAQIQSHAVRELTHHLESRRNFLGEAFGEISPPRLLRTLRRHLDASLPRLRGLRVSLQVRRPRLVELFTPCFSSLGKFLLAFRRVPVVLRMITRVVLSKEFLPAWTLPGTRGRGLMAIF